MSSEASELEVEEATEQDVLLDLEGGSKDAEEEADENEEEVLKLGALLTIFFSLQVGVFLAAVDGTIVATLTSKIASEFHEFRSVSWIITGYLIAQATFLPLYGKLSDIFGRKPVLLMCNLCFGLGTVFCGLAPNLISLVVARVIAGCGGGGLFTMSVIILSDIVPLRQRGLFQGIGNIVYGSGAAVGGVIGGILAESVGWRWTFVIQGPIIVMSITAIQLNLQLPRVTFDKELLKRIDFLGSATLICGLCLFLFGVSAGGTYFSWTHPFIIGSLTCSAVVLSVFVYIELFIAVEPVIDLSLLKNRSVAGSTFTGFFLNMIYYTNIFYIAIYMLTVKGVTATTSGTVLIPQFVGTASGSFAAGYYTTRTGRYFPASALAAVVLFLGQVALSTVGLDTPQQLVSFLLFPQGFGSGLFFTTTLIALVASVPYEVQAVCTSVAYGFRSIGSTLGIAIAAAIFSNTLAAKLNERITGPGSEEIIRLVQDSVDEIVNVPSEWRTDVTLCFLDAVHSVLYTVTFLSLLTGISSLFMKEHVLHKTIQRR
ncbi:major facilitator superfamily domain-containing protein [Lipomyces kononenkoae]|uniref:Major facilitator superfamily domain-containing protein n=1 Tax=Lipomyces kononenkoae TaxID=34357 RepID=A0ACC3SXU8_LIPKO